MGGSIENMFSGGQYYGNKDIANSLPGIGQSYQSQLGPWITGGENAYGNYQQAINNMQDPEAYYQSLMRGYTESPQAKQAIQQGIQAANAATAASGMQGSGAEQTALQKQGQDIVAADQQNWLNNMLGIANQYIAGQGGLQQEGLGAQESVGGLQAKLAQAAAQAQAKSEEAQQSGKNSAIGGGLGLLGNLGSDLPFGVGSFFS